MSDRAPSHGPASRAPRHAAGEAFETTCPRCGFRLDAESIDCARCGVVLAKLEAAVEAVPPVALVSRDESGSSGVARLDAEARRALVVGAAIAAVVLALPFVRFVFSYVITLVHELGHAATSWFFGYPSVPAFDFTYGGGVTTHVGRRPALVFLIAAAIAAGLWALRGRTGALLAGGAAALLYAILAASPLHELCVTAMGHLGELAFTGIFFYRALSGYAVRARAERPLYAFLAYFIVARDLHFATGLVRSEAARRLYGEAKGGGHWMDFSLLAHDLGVGLETVAAAFWICTAAVLPLTWLVFRRREAIAGIAIRLWAPLEARTR